MPSQKTIDDFEEKHLLAMMAQEQQNHMADAIAYGVAAVGGGGGGGGASVMRQARGRRSPTLEEKLCMRMGWDDIRDIPPGIRLSIINSGTAIFLTIITVANDEVVTLKDEPAMFPSDQIVTQLRMLANG